MSAVAFNRGRVSPVETGRASAAAAAKDTTLRAVGPALVIGQLVGLVPVLNVTEWPSGAARLAFRRWSLRSIFALAIIVLSLVELAMACRRFLKVGFSLGGATVIFFYLSTSGTALLLYHLAASGNFKRVMEHFDRTERIFADEAAYPVEPGSWTLCRKIWLLTGIVIPLCLLEHGMYLLAKMTNVYWQIQKCHFQIHLYEHFIRTERKHMYPFIPFSFYVAVPFEITNTCNTIAWTFLDLLIMIYSIALAHRFQQVSWRIRRVLVQSMSDDFWAEVRSHFVALQDLTATVDNNFSYMILLSCATDVYFTCYLLFNSFGDFPEKLNALYFYFSIGFIISRTLMTLYFATTVHEAARRPYILVKSVTHEGWGAELERFAYQMRCEVVALSGRQYFYFTRNVILTLIGTIITYELVIVDHILEQPEIVQKTCQLAYNLTY